LNIKSEAEIIGLLGIFHVKSCIILTKAVLAPFWAIFSQTHLVALLNSLVYLTYHVSGFSELFSETVLCKKQNGDDVQNETWANKKTG
jgi:hypothetical protein